MPQLDLSIRSTITAPDDHYLVNFDLAQAESWVVAYLANEPTMKDVLANGDFHRETGQKALYNLTDEAWEQIEYTQQKTMRYTGKRYNHASAYRMGPHRAAEIINKDSDKPPYVTVTIAESKIFYQKWHDYYHIKGWWDEIEWQLNQTRTLKTPYGRLRYFFAAWGNELFKEATAFVPQSTVADHLNGMVQREVGVEGGLLQVHRRFVETGAIKVINQAHDSILCEIPCHLALDISQEIVKLLLRPIVINGEEFTIPVDAEVGVRWGELVAQDRKVGTYDIPFKFEEPAWYQEKFAA